MFHGVRRKEFLLAILLRCMPSLYLNKKYAINSKKKKKRKKKEKSQ